MGGARKGPSQKAESTDQILNSIARSLDLLVKLKVKELFADRKQNDVILELHSVGCRPVEIAGALGTTPNSVNPVISRARKKGSKRGK